MMHITFKQLQVFVAIAKTQNMSQAAESLCLTQSACSMALSTLEKQLSVPLFDRHGKKLLLNDRGKALFTKAANIIQQILEIELEIPDKNKKELSGSLIIGGSTTPGNYILPSLIGKFVSIYPNTKIKLRVSDSNLIIDQLLKFNIDLGFVEVSYHSDDIETLPWRQDELVVIASPKHPLAKKTKITRNDLKNASLILREANSETRKKFEEAMQAQLPTLFELGHTEAIKEAVKSGLGIGCISKHTITESLKNRQLVILKTPFLKLTRQLYILIHKEKYRSAVLNEFLKFLE